MVVGREEGLEEKEMVLVARLWSGNGGPSGSRGIFVVLGEWFNQWRGGGGKERRGRIGRKKECIQKGKRRGQYRIFFF